MNPTILYNIEIEQGSDFSNRFTYLDNSTNLPIDLTGFRAEMQIRMGYNGDTYSQLLLDLNTDTGGGIVLGGVAGTIDISIPYASTMTVDWNQASYDLILIDPYARRSKYAKGFITINRSSASLGSSALTDISATKTLPYPQPNNYGAGGTIKT